MPEKPTPRPLLPYLLAAALGCRFGLGVWVLYYLRVTNYAGIGLAEGLMILVTLIVELPTGALADLIGRKRTLNLGFGFLSLSFLVFWQLTGLGTLCLACMLYSLGKALNSGTYEALLFDTLQVRGKVSAFGQVLAETRAIRLFVTAVSCAVGGLLYQIGPSLPYLATMLCLLVGFLISLFLEEPAVNRPAFSANAFREQTRRGLTLLRGALSRDALIGFLFVVGMFTCVTDEVIDDALAVSLGLEPSRLGLLVAMLYLGAAIAARFAPLLEAACSSRRLALVLVLASAVTLILAPLAGVIMGASLILVRTLMLSVLTHLETRTLNDLVDSANRATLLSSYTMLKSLPYVLGAYLIGGLIDTHGPPLFARGMGLVLLSVALLLVLLRARTFFRNGGLR